MSGFASIIILREDIFGFLLLLDGSRKICVLLEIILALI